MHTIIISNEYDPRQIAIHPLANLLIETITLVYEKKVYHLALN